MKITRTGRVRPCLEVLEDRTAPAVYAWGGAAVDPGTGNPDLHWTRPGNWSVTYGSGYWSTDAVPGPSDTARFVGGYRPVPDCIADANVSVGRLEVVNGWAGTLTVAGGKTLSVGVPASTGVSAWTSGTLLLGTGSTLYIVGNTTVSGTGAVTTAPGAAGAVVVNGGAGYLTLSAPAASPLAFKAELWVGYDLTHAPTYSGRVDVGCFVDEGGYDLHNTGITHFSSGGLTGGGLHNHGALDCLGAVSLPPVENVNLGGGHTPVMTIDGTTRVGAAATFGGYAGTSVLVSSSVLALAPGANLIAQSGRTVLTGAGGEVRCLAGSGASWNLTTAFYQDGGTVTLSYGYAAGTNEVYGTLQVGGGTDFHVGRVVMHVAGLGPGNDQIALYTEGWTLACTGAVLELYTAHSPPPPGGFPPRPRTAYHLLQSFWGGGVLSGFTTVVQTGFYSGWRVDSNPAIYWGVTSPAA